MVAIVCGWAMAGHALWDVAGRACYTYVHQLKAERSFRDTLTLDYQTYHNKSQVVWTKQNEIRYAGKMFDIKKTIQQDNQVVLVGHYDDFEHGLYKSLQKLFDNSDEHPQQNKRVDWTSLIAILPQDFSDTAPVFISPSVSLTSWSNCFFQSVSIPPLHNPPNLRFQITG